MLAYANRTSGGRYGHLGAFRTQIVVDAVLEARSVPASVPWDVNWHEPDAVAASLEIESAEVPRYPGLAYRAGISGEVEIEVKVGSGKVIETKVKTGDRMLAIEAVKNIKTWNFSPKVTTTFTTKFVYLLEKGPRRPDRNPKIELEYPFLVKVTAPYFGW
jgi:TonB family protein